MGSVPGIPGAHTQGASVEEVRRNLVEALDLLGEAGALGAESEFVGTMQLALR